MGALVKPELSIKRKDSGFILQLFSIFFCKTFDIYKNKIYICTRNNNEVIL